MASPDEIRQNVSDAFLRFMTQREFDLAHRLYHTDYVNHEAASERSHGPEGAIATVEWLHSCFGDLRYAIERIIVIVGIIFWVLVCLLPCLLILVAGGSS